MIRLLTIAFLIVCIQLNQYSVEANVFVCNATASCGCSRFDADINARIVGGEVAASHSWGWAVSLRTSFGNSICGGSILSRNYILTAAHCVQDKASTPNLLNIVIGIDTLTSTEGQERSLSKIFVHPNYNTVTKENDIAILYLSTPIDLTDVNVAKICLPEVPQAEQHRYPIVKTPIVAIGWGTTSSGGYISNSLRQVTVRTIASNDKMCSKSLGNADVQFCAAVDGGGKDTCQGDSGGPIMYYSEHEQLWVLAGITSFGHGCASPYYAGVYTRVSVYIDWIQSIVGNDGMVTIPQNSANIKGMSNMIIFILTLFLMVVHIDYFKT